MSRAEQIREVLVRGGARMVPNSEKIFQTEPWAVVLHDCHDNRNFGRLGVLLAANIIPTEEELFQKQGGKLVNLNLLAAFIVCMNDVFLSGHVINDTADEGAIVMMLSQACRNVSSSHVAKHFFEVSENFSARCPGGVGVHALVGSFYNATRSKAVPDKVILQLIELLSFFWQIASDEQLLKWMELKVGGLSTILKIPSFFAMHGEPTRLEMDFIDAFSRFTTTEGGLKLLFEVVEEQTVLSYLVKVLGVLVEKRDTQNIDKLILLLKTIFEKSCKNPQVLPLLFRALSFKKHFFNDSVLQQLFELAESSFDIKTKLLFPLMAFIFSRKKSDVPKNIVEKMMDHKDAFERFLKTCVNLEWFQSFVSWDAVLTDTAWALLIRKRIAVLFAKDELLLTRLLAHEKDCTGLDLLVIASARTLVVSGDSGNANYEQCRTNFEMVVKEHAGFNVSPRTVGLVDSVQIYIAQRRRLAQLQASSTVDASTAVMGVVVPAPGDVVVGARDAAAVAVAGVVLRLPSYDDACLMDPVSPPSYASLVVAGVVVPPVVSSVAFFQQPAAPAAAAVVPATGLGDEMGRRLPGDDERDAAFGFVFPAPAPTSRANLDFLNNPLPAWMEPAARTLHVPSNDETPLRMNA